MKNRLKNRLFVGSLALIMILVLVGCSAVIPEPAPAPDTSPPPSSPTDGNDTTANTALITPEEAQAAAINHAGLSEANVSIINVHLDYDDGRQVYEVEFYSTNKEYDYDVDALSGEIVSYDTDIENYTISGGQQVNATIDEAAAKSTALAKVPGATDADIRIRLEYDDGQPVYEGSIVYKEMKYEFEISAVDGAILEWETESVYDD